MSLAMLPASTEGGYPTQEVHYTLLQRHALWVSARLLRLHTYGLTSLLGPVLAWLVGKPVLGYPMFKLPRLLSECGGPTRNQQ